MAQTGYTPIQLYYSSTTTNVPLAANLAYGELAINITDGKLFYKDNANAIQVIGWKVVPATAGGTGQTSYAVGDLIYADTTTSLAKLPDVATGNALISGGVNTAPSWGKIGLTTHVSGTLPVANGGTGLTSFNSAGLVWANSTSTLATTTAITVVGGGLGIYFNAANLSGNFWQARYNSSNFPMGVATGNSNGFPFLGVNVNGVGGSDNGAFDINGWASRLRMDNGQFQLQTSSASGTAGNAITWATHLSTTSGGDVTVPVGNLVIGTSGKGIDFSATPGTGTSELLADYEEGTWTPAVSSFSGSITSYTSAGTYTKVGRLVTVSCIFKITDNGTGATLVLVTGLPFTPIETTNQYACSANNRTTAYTLYGEVANARIQIYTATGGYPGVTNHNYCVTATYFV